MWCFWRQVHKVQDFWQEACGLLGCCVPSPGPNAAATNSRIHGPKATAWWTQSCLMSWMWIAQFSAKVTPYRQANAWGNRIENNTCQRSFVQITINKTCPTSDEPHRCVLSGKHFGKHFFFPKQHPQMWLPTIWPGFFISNCHILTQTVLPPLRMVQSMIQGSKEQVPKGMLEGSLGLWQPCVHMWLPQKSVSRTTAVLGCISAVLSYGHTRTGVFKAHIIMGLLAFNPSK